MPVSVGVICFHVHAFQKLQIVHPLWFFLSHSSKFSPLFFVIAELLKQMKICLLVYIFSPLEMLCLEFQSKGKFWGWNFCWQGLEWLFAMAVKTPSEAQLFIMMRMSQSDSSLPGTQIHTQVHWLKCLTWAFVSRKKLLILSLYSVKIPPPQICRTCGFFHHTFLIFSWTKFL